MSYQDFLGRSEDHLRNYVHDTCLVAQWVSMSDSNFVKGIAHWLLFFFQQLVDATPGLLRARVNDLNAYAKFFDELDVLTAARPLALANCTRLANLVIY